MHRTKKPKLPTLTAPAVRLLTLCALLILTYLPFVCVYAWRNCGDLYARTLVLEMLHSAAISVVLSLGGGLLLDCELRARENRGDKTVSPLAKCAAVCYNKSGKPSDS